jgi:hypothetical protein
VNVRPKIMGGVLALCGTGLNPNAASGSIAEPSTISLKPVAAEGQRRPQVARSTAQTIEYLIRQNDPERLRAFLAKHTRAERLAIKRHFESKK